MHEFEAELFGVEGNGAGDIFYLITNAVNTFYEGVTLSIRRCCGFAHDFSYRFAEGFTAQYAIEQP